MESRAWHPGHWLDTSESEVRTRRSQLMHKVLATVAVGALMAIAVPGVASAKGGNGVTVKGTCSARSESKLKVKTDDGRIETEFEVDQNVVGAVWKVTISDNGKVVATARKKTTAPSGSFELRKRIAMLPGTNHVSAMATNVATGEVCSAQTTL
jgi:hypothetical protein